MKFGPGAFRLCLAGAVLLSHLSRWDFGRPAVMLFFMLSGYWVTRMQDGPQRLPAPAFYLSRMLRIWPALAVTAAATLFALDAANMLNPGSFASTVAVLGLATRRDDLVGTIWSLDIELQFYLMLPILLAAKRYLTPSSMGALAAASFILGWIIRQRYGITTVFFYAPMFAIGASIYLQQLGAKGSQALGSIGLGILTLSALVFPKLNFHENPQAVRDAAFMAVSVLFGPFICWNVAQKSLAPDRLLGNLSYPLYLVQEPCIHIVQTQFNNQGAWKTVAVATVMIATASLYFLVDAPFERLRAAIFKPKRRLVQPA